MLSDIRIARLVVSITQCGPLKDYYFDMSKIDLACTYNGLNFNPIENRSRGFGIFPDSLQQFLERLHKESQAKFAQFMAYTLRNVFVEHVPITFWNTAHRTYFDDLVNDMHALGYEVTIKDGVEAAIIPLVLGGREEALITDELDRMLIEINPKLVETRQGAWEALLSAKDDSDRQAIASSRQLLAETLRTIGSGESREERVRSILKDKDAGVVEAIAKLVDSVYDLQSKGEHAKPTFDRALFVIKLTEYSLHYLLKNRSHMS